MRYVYCGECHKVSTNIWKEHDICMYCGNTAHRVPIRRPWQSYAGAAVFLVAAAALVLGVIRDDTVKTLVVLAAVLGGFALSSWGLRVARARVLEHLQTTGALPKEST